MNKFKVRINNCAEETYDCKNIGDKYIYDAQEINSYFSSLLLKENVL